MVLMSRGWVVKSMGPGRRLWIRRAPSRIAAGEFRNAQGKQGTMAPPTEALFAVSAAMMPSGAPVPNFLRLLRGLHGMV